MRGNQRTIFRSTGHNINHEKGYFTIKFTPVGVLNETSGEDFFVIGCDNNSMIKLIVGKQSKKN